MSGTRKYSSPGMLLVTGSQNQYGVAIALAILWLWALVVPEAQE